MRASNALALARTPQRSAFYFRIGYNDHTGLSRLIAEKKLHADGVILDARRHDRHQALRQQAQQADIATCLDTQAMELSLGAASKGHTELPWATAHTHNPRAYSAERIEQWVSAIVERTIEGDYAEVMAPAHYIDRVESEWLAVDGALTSELRAQLDADDREAVRLIYPLTVHHSVLYDAEARAILKRELRGLPAVDGILLRVQPFGAESGPQVVRSFIEACWDLRDIEVALMVGRSGLIGLSAYALGAVDAVESGITAGDSFNVGGVRSAGSSTDGFAPPQRVYVEALGMTVDLDVAAKLTATSRGKLQFACSERPCCRNGWADMLADAHRHSALARQRQYAALAQVPQRMRADHFIHSVLAPVCDRLARASDLHEPFRKTQRRMLSVKEVLVDLARERRGALGAGAAGGATRPVQSTAQVIPLRPR
jgi:hypothetical protein